MSLLGLERAHHHHFYSLSLLLLDVLTRTAWLCMPNACHEACHARLTVFWAHLLEFSMSFRPSSFAFCAVSIPKCNNNEPSVNRLQADVVHACTICRKKTARQSLASTATTSTSTSFLNGPRTQATVLAPILGLSSRCCSRYVLFDASLCHLLIAHTMTEMLSLV